MKPSVKTHFQLKRYKRVGDLHHERDDDNVCGVKFARALRINRAGAGSLLYCRTNTKQSLRHQLRSNSDTRWHPIYVRCAARAPSNLRWWPNEFIFPQIDVLPFLRICPLIGWKSLAIILDYYYCHEILTLYPLLSTSYVTYNFWIIYRSKLKVFIHTLKIFLFRH